MFRGTGLFILAMAAMAAMAARADIEITLLDAGKSPIPGVTCGVEGGPSGQTDGGGKIVLKNLLSSIRAAAPRAGASFGRIPLASGERARVTVYGITGRKVLEGTLSQGQSLPLVGLDRGLYHVTLHGPRSTSRSLLPLGRDFTFHGVPPEAASASLAKAAQARDVLVLCSKPGFVTQAFKLADGSSLTADFSKPKVVPLFDASTPLEPEVLFDRGDAVVTQWGDRARDRHAREDQDQQYDHYLTWYWIHRTARFIMVDKVAKGGKTMELSWVTEWKLQLPAEFRAWYLGRGTVAEYSGNYGLQVKGHGKGTYDAQHNRIDTAGHQYKYTFTFDHAMLLDGRSVPLAVGQFMELEPSQFLDESVPEGRARYYGTTYLYEVGKGGMVPWRAVGRFEDKTSERENSHKIDEKGWLGGRTTLPYQYSDEPDNHFMQMATNLSGQNAQPFVLGRRVLHTDFLSGVHDEPDNPVWEDQKGKGGPHYINTTCNSCHTRNGRSPMPEAGKTLSRSVVKVADAEGRPHPRLGSVLQPRTTGASPEGAVNLTAWVESNGLRKPAYGFAGGPAPDRFSVRSSPRLVGMGLLEAVPEAAIQALEDPEDTDGDGVSGRANIVPDPRTGVPRLGRFGWKAGKGTLEHQVAAALNTDMGVMTTVLPDPDCGSEQADCGSKGAELADRELDNLVTYIRLLGLRARRDLDDPVAAKGEEVFASLGCVACHTPTLKTGAHHPKAELRGQTLHPYTDLLLHDMGPGLADNLGEGLATGSEWRTAPLWNLGLDACVTGGVAGPAKEQVCTPHGSYLHDGRAATLEEAILWHGGEAAKSVEKYKALAKAETAALIKFLESL